jgi:hypothetical protein
MTQLELILSALAGVSTVISFAFWRGNSRLDREYCNMTRKYDEKAQHAEKLRDNLQTERKHHSDLKVASFNYINYVEKTYGPSPVPAHLHEPFRGIVGLPRVETYRDGSEKIVDGKGLTRVKFGNLDPKDGDRVDVQFQKKPAKVVVESTPSSIYEGMVLHRGTYGDFDTAYKSPEQTHVGTCSTDTSHQTSHSSDTSSSSYGCDTSSSSSFDSGSCPSSCD